jgi:hypothetical protein
MHPPSYPLPHFTSTFPPGAEMACLMGFHLVGNRRSAEDRRLWSNPDISYSIRPFSSCFCHWAAEKGKYRFRLILQSHTHVHLILYRPCMLMFFCPRVLSVVSHVMSFTSVVIFMSVSVVFSMPVSVLSCLSLSCHDCLCSAIIVPFLP